MIQEYLNKITMRQDLAFDEAYDAMLQIMEGKVPEVILSGFLLALKTKGESADEIAGFAKAMREKSIKINSGYENTIDVCGTGGDNSGSFNISTAVAFVVAGAGVPVAKHGNKSISSRSGSADVLRELGVNIEMSHQISEAALNEIGITFLFAPVFHPAMKYAANVRKQLNTRTVFNLLGPLTNPASVKRQIVGVFNSRTAKLLSQTAMKLGYDKIKFLCNRNRFDEVLLEGETEVFTYESKNGFSDYKISNKDFDYPQISFEKIKGGSPADNSRIINDVFSNMTVNGAFHTITANAALALFCAGYSNDLKTCLVAAEDSVKSGSAFKKLKQLKEFSNKKYS